MLDLYKLQIFNAVVQEGSFTAAAERLYITQSAVSQHIKDLESGLGRTLFQRGRRGVKLTPHGEVLHRYAREIFALVARAEVALTDVSQLEGGRVSLGATPGVAVYLAPAWVQRFRARYPHLTVGLQTGVTSQVVDEVVAHRLDLGIIEGELEAMAQQRIQWLPLAEVEQKVIVGMAHPWAGIAEVPIDALHRQAFIMRPPNSQTRIWLDSALRVYGVEPLVGAEFDNLESIKRAIANGQCITILPEYIVSGELEQGMLRAVPLAGAPLKRTLKLIWARDSYFSPVTRAFLGELVGEYPALLTLPDSGTER
jgi:DNA-binding transcriptional LysR family regulator